MLHYLRVGLRITIMQSHTHTMRQTRMHKAVTRRVGDQKVTLSSHGNRSIATQVLWNGLPPLKNAYIVTQDWKISYFVLLCPWNWKATKKKKKKKKKPNKKTRKVLQSTFVEEDRGMHSVPHNLLIILLFFGIISGFLWRQWCTPPRSSLRSLALLMSF